MPLPKYQIEANKRFFLRIIQTTVEGGMYIWMDEMATFIQYGNKLYGTKSGLSKVERITDEQFVKDHFDLLDVLNRQ